MREASARLAKKNTVDLAEMPRTKKAHRGGSLHYPKKNNNWKTRYVTTDKRVMLFPVALSE